MSGDDDLIAELIRMADDESSDFSHKADRALVHVQMAVALATVRVAEALERNNKLIEESLDRNFPERIAEGERTRQPQDENQRG